MSRDICKYPSQLVYSCDQVGSVCRCICSGLETSKTQVGMNGVPCRPGGHLNAVMVDGHVESMRGEAGWEGIETFFAGGTKSFRRAWDPQF